MSITGERKAIWYVLRQLSRDGEKWYRKPKNFNAARKAAGAKFSPLSEQALESYLLHQPRGSFGEEVLYVRPPGHIRKAATALWCRWDFQNGAESCWFYLGIWPRKKRFLGFRFEMPESVGDNHNYYHSQPCRNMGRRSEPLEEALRLPERNPTWPLAAQSPLELLLCLMLSIRGMKGVRALKVVVDGDAAMRRNKQLCDAVAHTLQLAVGP